VEEESQGQCAELVHSCQAPILFGPPVDEGKVPVPGIRDQDKQITLNTGQMRSAVVYWSQILRIQRRTLYTMNCHTGLALRNSVNGQDLQEVMPHVLQEGVPGSLKNSIGWQRTWR
jgi:hypothetical protein